MIWEIISSVAAAISVIIAVAAYLHDSCNKKTAETIHAVDRVLDSYYELAKGKNPKTDYDDYVKFLSIVERFATDANEGVIKKNLIKKRLSIFLINEYEQHLKGIITQRRKQFSRESYYKQIEDLIKYLQK